MKKRLILTSLLTLVLVIALVTAVAGCAGEPGLKGSQGEQGIQGEQGERGIQGDQGLQGEQGPAGASGAKGAKGATGSKGATGAKGDQGEPGTPGATGARGSTGSKGATGAAGSQGSQGIQGLVGEIVATPGHSPASGYYQAANIADSVVLGEGDWMIVASGAMNVTYLNNVALNVGLRIWEGETAIMIAKSNLLTGAATATVDRIGFALVGTVSVSAGQTLEVELVHYGGGDHSPFEWNIVAIGGIAP